MIVFDIYATGHHSEYIEHLLRYIINNERVAKKYFFVLNREFEFKLKDLIELSKKYNTIEIIYIEESERINATTGSLFSQSFKQLDLVSKYSKVLNIKEVLLMHFNVFQIALCFKRVSFKITGILFSQFTRQDTSGNFKEKIRYLRRFIQTLVISKRKVISKIFILNDIKSCEYLNSQFNTNIFTYLPDPLPVMEVEKYVDVRRLYDIDNNRKIFFHFGSLSARKGTFDIINCIDFIPIEVCSRITLIFAGKVTDSQELDAISNLIDNKRIQKSKIQIIFEEGFISNNLKSNLFLQCDYVLMPYKNVEASSGILGHAILAKKPVISTGKGLLREIVENFKMGLLINEVNPRTIADAIINSQDFIINEHLIENYISEHKASNFANALIG